MKSFSTKMALVYLATSTAASLSSCRITSSGVSPDFSKKTGASKVSDVRVQLPASSKFKPTQGSAVVNTIRVTVRPKDPSCAGATQINETRSYDNPVINQKFRRGCDYLVTLALGESTPSGSPMKVYYQNTPEKAVAASELETSPFNLALNLTLTSEGQAASMPANIDMTPNPVPPTVPGQQALASKLQVKVTNSSGQQVDLSSVFTSEYLLIDYSQTGCAPCMQHANEMNAPESNYPIRFSGSGKCTSMIMMEEYMMADWIKNYNKSSFVGRTTYTYTASQGLNQFAKLFGGGNITGTPTFMLVDRKGKIVGERVGAEPSEVDTLCN